MNLRPLLFIALAVGAVRAPAAETKAAVTPAPASPAPAATSRPAAVAAAAPRNDSSVAPSATFDTFRLITDRNIFNTYRTGRRERNNEDRPPRVDTITLVGTMNYDKGLFAFFDSSDAAYRKALHVGEDLAQFKVTQVAPNTVALEREAKTVTMRLGQQLRRPEGGDWALVGADVALAEAQAQAHAAEAAKIDPTAPPAIPANASDVMKRLMERRQKDLKQ